jgi:hypothetical protein
MASPTLLRVEYQPRALWGLVPFDPSARGRRRLLGKLATEAVRRRAREKDWRPDAFGRRNRRSASCERPPTSCI